MPSLPPSVTTALLLGRSHIFLPFGVRFLREASTKTHPNRSIVVFDLLEFGRGLSGVHAALVGVQNHPIGLLNEAVPYDVLALATEPALLC